jgi:hypothetical protein
MLFTQQYGFRTLAVIADAWGRTAQGQFMDMPKGKLPAIGDYQHIIGLKTAPLFEVSCDLGVRAAKMDHNVNLAKDYGFNCGMAFQVYDDLTDLLKNLGRSWESTANGPLPMSMQALRKMLESGTTVSPEDCERVEGLAQRYLQRAIAAADAFPASQWPPLLVELPQCCCSAVGLPVHLVANHRAVGQLVDQVPARGPVGAVAPGHVPEDQEQVPGHDAPGKSMVRLALLPPLVLAATPTTWGKKVSVIRARSTPGWRAGPVGGPVPGHFPGPAGRLGGKLALCRVHEPSGHHRHRWPNDGLLVRRQVRPDLPESDTPRAKEAVSGKDPFGFRDDLIFILVLQEEFLMGGVLFHLVQFQPPGNSLPVRWRELFQVLGQFLLGLFPLGRVHPWYFCVNLLTQGFQASHRQHRCYTH